VAETALLVGSVPLDVSVTIDGSAQAIEGDYYLRHATGALSLLTAFQTEMTAAGVAAAAVTVRENLRIRLASSGTFDVTWSSTALRELFGFTGNLSGASSYDATNPSPLLWAPGYPATPRSHVSKAGRTVPHVTFHAADDGSEMRTQHFGSEVWQDLSWRTLLSSRLTVPDGTDTGNTLEGFFEEVLQYGYRFRYHQSVVTSTATTALDWNDSVAFGPYQLRRPMDHDWYERIIANADVYGGPVKLELKLVEEYA
jgi:hypothetical protein